MASHWTAANIPPQTAKLALITGANSGIGFHAAKQLAAKGCTVILACRDLQKAEAARDRILVELPEASLEIISLDLASLASVRSAASTFLAGGRTLDLLINNAGVMALPKRQLTPDGFEMQFGTNHLGHFALTGLLLPAILSAPAARIITVSSIAHKSGVIRFDDLQWNHGYKPWPAYRQSKLANLLFGFELQRRLDHAHTSARSIVVHPGVSATNLFAAGPGKGSGLLAKIVPPFIELMAQSDAQGALPTLFAAVSPDAQGGLYYGPDGWREMRGWPVEVKAEPQAYDEDAAARLWQISEELTGVRFKF
ncbi:oxidoreductase [Paracidobacterium acidisoli]|uniref:SDR family NAD(P)-dependent oxidoreductase n=1 Tax=Paracidobacterium acidisoli TaxID=2303751 RepID=A0A372INW2_9BACT|nr:oxidoreductase [Paracidobacterium acidisoli]MBT9332105.1 SDR family oxidoreductase [Paracidobacterium acidisoli]